MAVTECGVRIGATNSAIKRACEYGGADLALVDGDGDGGQDVMGSHGVIRLNLG